MFQQVIPRSFVWLVSLGTVLIIGIIGCGGEDDENEWVWHMGNRKLLMVKVLNKVFVEDEEFGDAEIDFSITANEWTFSDDGTMEMELGMKFESERAGA